MNEIKTQFTTREGLYKLLSHSEYSRPNRVPFNSQGSNPVRVSFVNVNDQSGNGDRLCFNVGRELYFYIYKGVRKVPGLGRWAGGEWWGLRAGRPPRFRWLPVGCGSPAAGGCAVGGGQRPPRRAASPARPTRPRGWRLLGCGLVESGTSAALPINWPVGQWLRVGLGRRALRTGAASAIVGYVRYGVTSGTGCVCVGPLPRTRLLGPSLVCRNEGWLPTGKVTLGLFHLLLQVGVCWMRMPVVMTVVSVPCFQDLSGFDRTAAVFTVILGLYRDFEVWTDLGIVSKWVQCEELSFKCLVINTEKVAFYGVGNH